MCLPSRCPATGQRVTVLRFRCSLFLDTNIYCHILEVTVDGVWIGELDLLTYFYTPLGTTSNYNATANLHSSQITTAPNKPFPACCVNSHSLASASGSGDSSSSRPHIVTVRRISRN
jgi:hypothetical protein